MATTQENHEVADPMQAKSDTQNIEPGNLEDSNQEPVSSLQGEKEPVTSKLTDTDPTNKETESSEQAEKQPVSDEVQGLAQAETKPASEDVPGSEQAEQQVVSKDSTESQGEPVHDDRMDSEPADREATHMEPLSSELAHQKSAKIETVNSHHDGADAQPDVVNATVTAENEQVVERNPTDAEAMGMERVSSENVDQQGPSSALVHSEAVSLEHVSGEGEPMRLDNPNQQPTELAYSHSDASELAVSQSMSSEHLHSQPFGSEHVSEQQVHTEFVDSQSFDHEPHADMYNVETLHQNSEFVKMEHGHPEPMLQVSSELMHQLQVSSDLDHQLQVSSDLVHMQPIGSEIIHSQPMNSDMVHSEPPGPDFDNSPTVGSDMANMQIVVTDMVNSEPADPETTQPSKRRKKKSIVWEHFTIETVGDGCRRACCKVCKQSFAYSTGSKVAGTSHLKRHIAKGTCPLILRQQEKNQLTPYVPKSAGAETGTPGTTDPPKRRYRSASSPYLIFDQDKCRHEIARMIIMHEYPLHMVEHSGFVAFAQSLQPRFDMVNFNTVQGDCVATYLREKQNLQKFIDGMPGRICLTLDMWTSNQTTGYVFLHGQFIDHEWKLHRRLLNIVMEPFPESDNALSHAVATCLSYWNLDNKLCSITFNQPVSDSGRENMRGLISVKNPAILNGQLLMGSCLARALSGMAQEVLAAGQDAVGKIKSSVKYVKTSDAHEEKFLELKQQLQVPSEKTLTHDNVTQWSSSYYMLVAACELKEVFSCLDTSDPEYKDAPTMEDWKMAENICMYLKLLHETANFLVAKMPPSTNIFFHEVWKIQLELTRNAASEDPFVSNVAGRLQAKFLKYWRDSFLVLAIAVAMDPRFKMKLVEFSFTKLFGEEAPAYIRMVDEGIHQLFHEYAALPLPLTPAYAEGGNSGSLKAEENQPGNLISSNGLTDFDMYIMETTSQQMKSELDQYLDESLLPRVQDIDVLGWWKMNRLKYPTLSKMARDILTVPLSSVGPDYVFDTVGREMDQYRSSLRPETMEALMCAKDWLQYQQAEASNGHM